MVGFETSDEGAAVDIVKGLGEQPIVFRVVDFEAAVCWNATGWILVLNRAGRELTNYSGWMGLKSVPTTLVDGYAFARISVNCKFQEIQEQCGCRPTKINRPVARSSRNIQNIIQTTRHILDRCNV
jgi:hypothetical protein